MYVCSAKKPHLEDGLFSLPTYHILLYSYRYPPGPPHDSCLSKLLFCLSITVSKSLREPSRVVPILNSSFHWVILQWLLLALHCYHYGKFLQENRKMRGKKEQANLWKLKHEKQSDRKNIGLGVGYSITLEKLLNFLQPYL